jgi:hypothetical protein
MAESGWPMSEVTQEHQQNLVSQEYMTMTELATYRVPEDPASPTPVGGYVMACMVFYEKDSVCHHTNFFTPYCSSMA